MYSKSSHNMINTVVPQASRHVVLAVSQTFQNHMPKISANNLFKNC